jgi:hypothetical protein
MIQHHASNDGGNYFLFLLPPLIFSGERNVYYDDGRTKAD